MLLKLGVNAKAYRNTGTYETPVWDELSWLSDLAVKADWDQQDTPRRSQRVKQKVKTLLDLAVTFKHYASDKATAPGGGADDPTADYTALYGAFVTDDVLDVLVLNGAKEGNGVRGFRFDCQVTGASEGQGESAVLMDDMQFTPCPSANAPQAVLVAGGALTFKPLTDDLAEAFA